MIPTLCILDTPRLEKHKGRYVMLTVQDGQVHMDNRVQDERLSQAAPRDTPVTTCSPTLA
jgi:hypothetical protein